MDFWVACDGPWTQEAVLGVGQWAGGRCIGPICGLGALQVVSEHTPGRKTFGLARGTKRGVSTHCISVFWWSQLQVSTLIEQVVEDETEMEGLPQDCSKFFVWRHYIKSSYSYPWEWSMKNNLDSIVPVTSKFWYGETYCNYEGTFSLKSRLSVHIYKM